MIFPPVTALGRAPGVVDVPLPVVERFIALSGGVLGPMVAFAVRAPPRLAGALVGVLAICRARASEAVGRNVSDGRRA